MFQFLNSGYIVSHDTISWKPPSVISCWVNTTTQTQAGFLWTGEEI